MADALRHRGPDGTGAASGPTFHLGVQHLRIMAPDGPPPQPFSDPTSGVYLICNGEIYNAPELRRRFRDYPYQTGTDVEVILPLYLQRGADGISDLDGMFALAILDTRADTLILARDRAGEKPLHYCHSAGETWFASEIGALLAAGAPRRLDDVALRELLALGYVAEPRTPFESIRKVPAGATLVVSAGIKEVTRYWIPEHVTVSQHLQPRNELTGLLRASIEKQVRADAPVGVFASGGLDSSLIASIAAHDLGSPLPLFTVGFEEPSFDETGSARTLARHLGVPCTAVIADAEALVEAHEQLNQQVAEPLTDPAALPTWLLARAAREQVKVVLSGEGADELFGGYPTYLGHRLTGLLRRLPPLVSSTLHAAIDRIPVSSRKVSLEYLLKRLFDAAHLEPPERHHTWFGTGLAGTLEWEPGGAVRDAWQRDSDVLRAAMLVDYMTYLREGLLSKIDRATMQWSLEARAPYLDTALTDFAFGLPTDLRVRGLRTKVLLRDVARRRLPRTIRWRRKRGLSVPVSRLISRELRSDVDRMLGRDRWPFEGVLHSGRVAQLLSEHRTGQADHSRTLWTLFTIAKWNAVWAGGCR